MKLLLLLCLGLTLVCAHHEENHAVVTSNFDMSKLSGKWYSILLASDVKEKTEENRNMRVFIESMQALDNSSLLFKYHKEVNGECVELTFVTDETEEKGVYSFNYDGYNTFHITEAVYNDYIVFYLLNSNEKGTAQVMELVAQNSDVSLELKERFEELSQSYGIPNENILDMTYIDRCLQARGSN